MNSKSKQYDLLFILNFRCIRNEPFSRLHPPIAVKIMTRSFYSLISPSSSFFFFYNFRRDLSSLVFTSSFLVFFVIARRIFGANFLAI